MDNRPDSYDFDSARKLAKRFNLEFVPVLLPSSAEIILDKVIFEIRQFGLKKKSAIECIYPMMFVFDSCKQLEIKNLVCGQGADGHYGLSKKAMIHYREPIEKFQAYRKLRLTEKNHAQTETLKQIAKLNNITVHLPYMQKAYYELFQGLSWFDVHTPRQKELVRRDYPELNDMKLKKHLNLQLGDSGIAETIGAAVLSKVAPTAKSPVTAYNILSRKYA